MTTEQFANEHLEHAAFHPNAASYGAAMGNADRGLKMEYYIPPHMHAGLVKWILFGIRPGEFLSRFLQGDLFGAMLQADEENASAFRAYCLFLYNSAPRNCFGSVQSFNSWAEAGGYNGLLLNSNASSTSNDASDKI